MRRRPPRSTQSRSSAASDVYKRQVISRYAGMSVYPALDTESLGGVCCNEIVKELCGMCGDCTIWLYGGICPVTQCSKSLLNGPCGGAVEGKCEVDERLCAWDKICLLYTSDAAE